MGEHKGLSAGRTILLLAALFSALFVSSVLAASPPMAGKVSQVVGSVLAQLPEREARELKLDDAVYAGDRLTTPADGFVRLTLTDGTSLTLRPDTEFQIDEYRFHASRQEEHRGFFSLLKGGFKTISGLIGKSDREHYKVTTPVAFIGIRGTEYSARLCSGGDCVPVTTNSIAVALGLAEAAPTGLHGSVQSGAIGLTNNAGESVFGAGQSFHVADEDSAAEETTGEGFADDDFEESLSADSHTSGDPNDFAGGEAGGGGGGH